MKVIPYQDIYCGLVFENQSDFFFQQIGFEICELYEIQDGLYNFRIDLSQIKDKEERKYWRELKKINEIPDIYKPLEELDKNMQKNFKNVRGII